MLELARSFSRAEPFAVLIGLKTIVEVDVLIMDVVDSPSFVRLYIHEHLVDSRKACIRRELVEGAASGRSYISLQSNSAAPEPCTVSRAAMDTSCELSELMRRKLPLMEL